MTGKSVQIGFRCCDSPARVVWLTQSEMMYISRHALLHASHARRHVLTPDLPFFLLVIIYGISSLHGCSLSSTSYASEFPGTLDSVQCLDCRGTTAILHPLGGQVNPPAVQIVTKLLSSGAFCGFLKAQISGLGWDQHWQILRSGKFIYRNQNFNSLF